MMKKLIHTLILILSVCVCGQATATDPKPERVQLLEQLFDVLEANIANPHWLDTEAYEQFKSTMYSDEVVSLEEETFLKRFKQEKRKLPFSHLQIKTHSGSSSSGEAQPVLSWKELNSSTAYLKVRTFVTDAAPMVQALTEIGYEKYDHLIIDLRNNGGGSLDAPVVLGRFLTDETIDAGIHLTRAWYETHDRPATPEEISGFPYLKDFTYQGIGEMFARESGFRMVIPGHQNPVFQGKVYVLVNRYTASACEPLIDIFQKQDLAILVGERSAGEMLSATHFPINEKYSLFLPIADYQNAQAERLDKVGVEPDVQVPEEDALTYVLQQIENKG